MTQKKGKKKDTEKAILKAAKKVFIEKGYDGARMQEIADEADINKAMLHYYFRNKDALFGKIMEEAVIVMSNNALSSFHMEGTVMEKLESLVENHINTTLQNPHIPLFLLSELSRGKMRFQEKMKSRIMENKTLPNFIRQIVKEQQQGILRPVPPEHIILTVMSLLTFPFMAKAVFIKMLDIPEEGYKAMMEERKTIVIDILKKSFLLK